MPRAKREKPIYQRGPFRLYAREGRNHEIIWYDEARRRERSVSAGTSDDGDAMNALDRQYRIATGEKFCPTCGQSMAGDDAPLLLTAITDYLGTTEGRAGHAANRTRLGHVTAYLAATNPNVTVPAVGEEWVGRFRAWMAKRTYTKGNVTRRYSLGTIEGCVLQLAAAINATPGQSAAFAADPIGEVAQSPVFRADIDRLAAMFKFCLDPQPKADAKRWTPAFAAMAVERRTNLLRYLRAAVATWARPDAIYELKIRGQWHADAGVLDLNPPGRRQTKKHRPRIAVSRQFRPWLEEARKRDTYLPVASIRHAWDVMREQLDLPGDREAGEKLVRRSMATLGRKIIGEANWVQGKMMLGHVKFDTSDIYALPDPANLGLALAATEAIIDEIEARVPGAYSGVVTAGLPHGLSAVVPLKLVKGS